MLYLCNAFSPNMLPERRTYKFTFDPLDEEEVYELLQHDYVSAIGHESLSQILSERLQMPIAFNRIDVKLMNDDDDLLLAVANVPRLAEGQILSKEEISNLSIGYWLMH